MPFKSDKQRRYLYAEKPKVAKKFAMDSAKKGKMLKLRSGGPQDRGQEAKSQEKGFDQSDLSNPYSDASQSKQAAENKAISDRHSKNNPTTTKTPTKTPERKFYKPTNIPTIGPASWALNKVVNAIGPKAYDYNKKKRDKFAKKEGLVRDFYRMNKTPLEVMDPKNKGFLKDAGYGPFNKEETTRGGNGQPKCPDGSLPPCVKVKGSAASKPAVKPAVKKTQIFDNFKAYKKGKMIKAKGGGGFQAMVKAGGPKIQKAFENVISRNLKTETDPVRRNKFMQYGSVPINELESKVKQMRALNKKIKKPEDKSKTFFGGFKAYAKKGKMIKKNKGGGVPYGPPPLRGPNPQVPPVKFSRGGGAAIRGLKFTGVK